MKRLAILAALSAAGLSACQSAVTTGGRTTTAARADSLEPAQAQCDAYDGPAVAELTHYEGLMHEHSSYSDGHPNYIPADYYRIAKENGYSFAGGSEHSDSVDSGVYITAHASCVPGDDEFGIEAVEGCFLNPTGDKLQKWLSTADQAAAATDDGDFLAIRGFEWTSDVFGHINVYFSKNFTNAKTDGGYALTMKTFWDWFTRDPDMPGDAGSPSSPVPFGGGADGLAHFNHPHDKCFTKDDPTALTLDWCDWNDYELIPAAEPRVFGIEVYNDGNRDDKYLSYYTYALDKGWHLSPIGSEDEHFAQYAVEFRPKTVTLATELSEAGFKEAWLARRTYALTPGRHLRAEVVVNNEAPMGARLSCGAGSVPMTVRVTESDGTTPFRGTYTLYTNGGERLASVAGTQAEFTLPVEAGAERYYFVRVDDDEGVSAAYLAPVWITGK